MQKTKQLEKEIQQLKDKLASQASANLIDQVKLIAGVKVLVAQLNGADNKALRGMVDELKNQLGSGIILLGNVADDKVGLIAGVTNDLTAKVKAGSWLTSLPSKSVVKVVVVPTWHKLEGAMHRHCHWL